LVYLVFFGWLPTILFSNKHACVRQKNGLVESAVFNWFSFFSSWRYEMLGQAQRDLTAEQAARKLFSQPDVHYKADVK